MKKALYHHWPALLIATIFFGLGTLYSVINPLFEALDEVWHYPFVWHLAQTGQLPVQDPANVQLWRQEASQPPLYYALAALLTAPIPSDDLPDLIYPNPHADLGVVTADGNINMIIHTRKEAWPWQNAVLAAHLARLFSVLLSTGTVLTIYGIGHTLWPTNQRFALLAMSFVAFNPMFIFVSASVNNDNLIILLASLIIWQLIVLVINNKPPTWSQFVILGGLIGLAALSKFSGLGLLGLTGLTLLWWGWRWRLWQTMLGGNAIVVLISAAITGWWYWRNFTLYDGDWTGTQNMVEMMGGRAVRPTAGQLTAEIPGMMRSFWGLFGGFSVAIPAVIYWLLNTLLMIGLGGLAFAVLTGRTHKLPPNLKQVWPVLVGWLILMIIGLIQWTLRTPATQGRLLFPALAALAPLWAAGWLALFPARWPALPTVGLLLLALWVPWGLISPTYAVPQHIDILPASAGPLEATFADSITLLAYQGESNANISPGDTLPLILYWQGQQSVNTDYSIFIHLIDENNLIVAQRDVFPGLGLYPTTQWANTDQPFADTYTLNIPGTAYAPATLHFGVGLYDNKTGVRLPVSSGGDVVYFGEIDLQSPAGKIPNPQTLEFEDGVSLAGYKVEPRQASPNESVQLTLYWQAYDAPSTNYKIFVHLVAQGDVRAAQDDSEPQQGGAPTSTWLADQQIEDVHTLTINPQAPAGAYRIKVGLYNGETGQRLRLLRDGGVSVQADSVTLSGIQITPP